MQHGENKVKIFLCLFTYLHNHSCCSPQDCARPVPYKGLSDMKVCELANNIISEIVKWKMKVTGMHVYILCCVKMDHHRVYNRRSVEYSLEQGKFSAIVYSANP